MYNKTKFLGLYDKKNFKTLTADEKPVEKAYPGLAGSRKNV